MTSSSDPILAPSTHATMERLFAENERLKKQALCHHDFSQVGLTSGHSGRGVAVQAVCVDCGFPCTVQQRADYERWCGAAKP